MNIFQIQNIQDLPQHILHKIFCYLELYNNIQLTHTSIFLNNTTKNYGIEGISKFQNIYGITYKYYCLWDILQNDIIVFRSLQEINLNLKTITDVLFLQKLIQGNRRCLSKLIVRNCFLKDKCNNLNQIGHMIQLKNLVKMVNITCVNFNYKTIDWILPFFLQFKMINFIECKLSQNIVNALHCFAGKLKLIDVEFIVLNYFTLNCTYLEIGINNELTPTSLMHYEKLLTKKYKVVQCKCNKTKILKILPYTINNYCHWKITGFEQLHIFLKKYKTNFFPTISLVIEKDFKISYPNINFFVKILSDCNNYGNLNCDKAFLTIKKFAVVLEVLKNKISNNQTQFYNTQSKMMIIRVINDLNTISDAKKRINDFKYKFNFFKTFFDKVYIINTHNN